MKPKSRNFLITALGMTGIFAIYIISASNAPVSDNIGVLIVPPILLFFYGPLISFVFATFQTKSQRVNDLADKNFWGSIKNITKNMPRTFSVLGAIGLFSLVIGTITGGLSFIWFVIFFPFWAVLDMF